MNQARDSSKRSPKHRHKNNEKLSLNSKFTVSKNINTENFKVKKIEKELHKEKKEQNRAHCDSYKVSLPTLGSPLSTSAKEALPHPDAKFISQFEEGARKSSASFKYPRRRRLNEAVDEDEEPIGQECGPVDQIVVEEEDGLEVGNLVGKKLRDKIIATDEKDSRLLDQVIGGRKRRLYKQGLLSRKSKESERSLICWLLDDGLLYAIPLPGGKYHFRRWLNFNTNKKKDDKNGENVKVTLRTSDPTKISSTTDTAIDIQIGKNILTLNAINKSERDDWFQALQNTVERSLTFFIADEDPFVQDELEKLEAARIASERMDEDAWDRCLEITKKTELSEEQRQIDELKKYVSRLKERLSQERMYSARLENEIHGERKQADMAIARAKEQEYRMDVMVGFERKKRIELEKVRRKEKDEEDYQKLVQIRAIKEKDIIETQIKGLEGDKDNLKYYLNSALRENECLIKENKALKAALDTSGRLYRAGEATINTYNCTIEKLQKELLKLREEEYSRHNVEDNLREKCKGLQQDLDRVQQFLCSLPNATATFKSLAMKRGSKHGQTYRWNERLCQHNDKKLVNKAKVAVNRPTLTKDTKENQRQGKHRGSWGNIKEDKITHFNPTPGLSSLDHVRLPTNTCLSIASYESKHKNAFLMPLDKDHNQSLHFGKSDFQRPQDIQPSQHHYNLHLSPVRMESYTTTTSREESQKINRVKEMMQLFPAHTERS